MRSFGFWGGIMCSGKNVFEKSYLVRSIHTISYAFAIRWRISGEHIYFSSGVDPLMQEIKNLWIASKFSFFLYSRVYDSWWPLKSLISCLRTNGWSSSPLLSKEETTQKPQLPSPLTLTIRSMYLCIKIGILSMNLIFDKGGEEVVC